MTVEAPDLMSTDDIASYLRVARKTVQNRVINDPGFPDPVRGTSRPMLWEADAVLNHLLPSRAAGRSPKPARGSSA